MNRKIVVTSPSKRKIVVTGPSKRLVSPDSVAAALGGEAVGPVPLASGTPLGFVAVRRHLAENGGR